MKLVSAVITTMLLSATLQAHTSFSSAESENFSGQLQLQSMGYQGTLAAGYHLKLTSWYQTTLGLGYSPASITGHDIFNIFWQNHFPIAAVEFGSLQTQFRPYIGPSVIFGHSDDLFYELPEQYPASYYPPTALHYSLDFGVEMDLTASHGLALQWSLLDTEIAPLFDSSNDYKPFYKFGSAMVIYRYDLEN